MRIVRSVIVSGPWWPGDRHAVDRRDVHRVVGEHRAAGCVRAPAQRSALTVGSSPLRDRNASTASTRLSTAPEATSWREHASSGCRGRTSTARSSCALDSRNTSLAVAPSSGLVAFAPCGCSARLQLRPVGEHRAGVDRSRIARGPDREAQVAVLAARRHAARVRARCRTRRPSRCAAAGAGRRS